MKRILIALMAIALLAGVAMAQVKAVEDMTDLEKYEWVTVANRWRALDNRDVLLALTDSTELTVGQMIVVQGQYSLATGDLTYAELAVSEWATPSYWASTSLAQLVLGTAEEKWLNMVVEKANLMRPEHIFSTLVIFENVGRVEDANKLFLAEKLSTNLTMRNIRRHVVPRIDNHEEYYTALILQLRDMQGRFAPTLTDDGKLADEQSWVFDTVALIGDTDELSIDTQIALLVRLVRRLNLSDARERLAVEAITSEIKRLQELKDMIGG